MRELKFRAFDTENKAWTFVTLGDLICGACTENGDKPLSGAKQVWEQYTGLKDKNGKEIYEGDITNDGNHICIIRWSEHFTEFEAVNEGEGYASDIWYIAKYGEVIGNMHENQDLLGDTNVTDKEEE